MNMYMKSILFSLFLLVSQMSLAQKVFTTNEGAIHGYDPVAYFTEAKPVKGNDKYTFQWNDATWYFASQKNLDLFKAKPQQYAPQYGGYCAYGTSNGYKANTQPDAWTIVDGKLYLNYNTDVQKQWNPERQKLIPKADDHWKKLENQ
jgi:YHS domain-containing protein